MGEKETTAKIDKRNILQWKSQRNYVMGLICWTVGLGNCWRFPVAASLDGGGAFLLPYFLETFFIAIPMSFMEMGLGQFSNKGPIGIWGMAPLWKGIGYASRILIVLLMVYYNVVCCYLMFFLFASMSSVLPWTTCDPSWAKINCFTFADNSSIRLSCIENHGAEFCDALQWENSAVHYWRTRVLDMLPTEYNLGNMRWELVYCSAVSGFFVFLLNFQGTKSLERMVTFLTIFPYLQLVILLFVTLLDPGSSRGLKAFMMPDFIKLKTTSPWIVAFEQILFSIGLGLGGLTTLGSHCHFRNPVHIEAIAINLVDIATSLCYGIMIFNSLGAMSYDLNIPMDQVVDWKDTLLFAKVPLALTYLPGGLPQIWGLLFYSSVYIIGLRSQGLMMATILTTVYDAYPTMLEYTCQCSACASLLLVLLGYPYLTQMGSILINYVDNIVVGPTLLTLCFLETVGVVCIYGVTHFVDDMHFMLGFRSSAYWQIFWTMSPLILAIILTHSLINFILAWEDRPDSIMLQTLQWLIFSIPIFLLLVSIVARIVQQRKRFKCSKLFDPSRTWGPTDPILRKSREMFTAHAMTKEYMYRQTRVKEKISMQNEEDYELD